MKKTLLYAGVLVLLSASGYGYSSTAKSSLRLKSGLFGGIRADDKKKTFIIKADPHVKDDEYVVSHWTLTYRHGDVPPYVKKDPATPAAATAAANPDPLSTMLGSIYEDVSVTAHSNTLVIVGPKERVRRIKTILAKWIDVPFAQVKLNVLAFQGTARGYDAGMIDSVELAEAGINLTREFMRAYANDFAHFVAEGKQSHSLGGKDREEKITDLFGKFHLLGSKDFYADGDYESLSSGQRRVKPFVDSLAYLALSDYGQFRGGSSSFQQSVENGSAKRLLQSMIVQLKEKVRRLEELRPLTPGHRQALGAPANVADIDRGLEVSRRLLELCSSLMSRAFKSGYHDGQQTSGPFPLFNGLLASSDQDADLRALLDFMYEYSRPQMELPGESAVASKERMAEYAAQRVRLQDSVDHYKELYTMSQASIVALRQRILEVNGPGWESLIPDELKKAESAVKEIRERIQRLDLEIQELESLLEKTTTSELISDWKKRREEKLSERNKKHEKEMKYEEDIMALKRQDKKSRAYLAKNLSLALATTLATDADIAKQLDAFKTELKKVTDDEKKAQKAIDDKVAGVVAPKAVRPVDPEALTMLGTNVDILIKNAAETFSRDIEAGVIEPLKEWIQSNNRGMKTGLVLTGNVGVAVTSEQGASSGGEETHYLPFTPQQVLTSANLTTLLGIGAGVSGTSAEGFASLLKGLTALANGAPAYTPTFTSVSPGLSLAIRPTVLPGSDAARIQINVRAATSTANVGSTNPRPDPLSLVSYHETITDVAVNAFDLFKLSTFAVETTALGDPQWRIYGLEGIPILGNIFIGPRRPITNVGRSLMIVYTTILPRSLDIARRYSRSSD